MGEIHDLTGRQFGYLTVLRDSGRRYRRSVVWECECICGKHHDVVSYRLLSGNTKSCGCMTGAMIANNQTTHGMTIDQHRPKIYIVWQNMRQRCSNPNKPDYERYGGRGISVCSEWDNSFSIFYEWAITHGYSNNLEIDRIDVNGNYEPSNCRFVNDLQQASKK